MLVENLVACSVSLTMVRPSSTDSTERTPKIFQRQHKHRDGSSKRRCPKGKRRKLYHVGREVGATTPKRTFQRVEVARSCFEAREGHGDAVAGLRDCRKFWRCVA